MDWPPYLSLGGVELANMARTFDYVRAGHAGFGNRRFDLEGNWPLVLYRVAGASGFLSPQADPAPWYDPRYPQSADFLGVVLYRPAMSSVTSRAVTAVTGGVGGGAFDRRQDGPREFAFSATLIAASPAGRAYGFEWLDEQLSSTCDPCILFDMGLFDAMPPTDDGSTDNLTFFTYHDVACTTGLLEQASPDRQQSDWMDVSFTIAAGDPFRYTRPTIMVNPTILNVAGTDSESDPCIPFATWFAGDPGPMNSAFIQPATLGVNAPIVTLRASGHLHGVTIGLFSFAPNTGDEPDIAQLGVGFMEDSSQLVIDFAQQSASYTNPLGAQRDGYSILRPPTGGVIPWRLASLGECDEGIWVGAWTPHLSSYGAQATVEIDIVNRRR